MTKNLFYITAMMWFFATYIISLQTMFKVGAIVDNIHELHMTIIRKDTP